MTRPYDQTERHNTPLALKLKARIRREGPITVEQYMAACLGDAEHGYYVNRPAIGAKGDFVTAPEISQVFGELIGLWCAVVWQRFGKPGEFNLVELGPGRGTLITDALRAGRIVPGFVDAARLCLIETNAHLRKTQSAALAAAGLEATWASSLVGGAEAGCDRYTTRLAVPMAPTILIANEFLDTRPVRQVVRHDGLWFERTVGLDERGELAFDREGKPARGVVCRWPDQQIVSGDILEIATGHGDFTVPLQTLSKQHALAALLIDYGHARTQPGDTLQAVRNHQFEHPLTAPGEADLTAQVDFEDFAAACLEAGYAVDGPVTQADFLGSLGIAERASRLMERNPARVGEIEVAVARLMSPTGMGSHFKAIGVRSPGALPLPGLETR